MVLQTAAATLRLGDPSTTTERGTIEFDQVTYSQRWNWPCGCAGEIIAGSLIDVRSCALHAKPAR
ncbi:MAG TPA: hypothetical protein VFA29_06265 [Candidatus Baltobacteraceae bacterium]|nr:hypothetical protein [Candidatus Baltobacteraceae bacterium]